MAYANSCSNCNTPLSNDPPIEIKFYRKNDLPAFDVFCTWKCFFEYCQKNKITYYPQNTIMGNENG